MLLSDAFWLFLAKPVTRGEKYSPPLEKCVGYSLKILDIAQKIYHCVARLFSTTVYGSEILDIVQKIWAPFGKLFAPPGAPNWLRACS